MKGLRAILPIVITFGFVAICGAGETIRLASGEWAPYQSQELKHYGVGSRIVTEAFKIVGVDTEYGYFPWKRSLKMAKAGKWDGTFLWFDTQERRKSFYISDPILDIEYVFFHLRSYPFDWHGIEDLKGINIGGTLGYHYGIEMENAENENTINVEREPTDEQNFEKLLKGRIAVFPCDLIAGYQMLRQLFPAEKVKLFTHHPRPVRAAPHHVLLSRKIDRNKRMLELLNKGLSRLKKNGKIEEYLAESRREEYTK